MLPPRPTSQAWSPRSLALATTRGTGTLTLRRMAFAMEPQDYGFMYGWSFYDLDGHHWELMWMDPQATQ